MRLLATLETRCGCTKRIVLDHFAKTVQVPMQRDNRNWWISNDEIPFRAIDVREFVLVPSSYEPETLFHEASATYLER